jgi:hypothetical protein
MTTDFEANENSQSYRAYGLIIRSDFPLSELSPRKSSRVDIQIRTRFGEQEPFDAHWFMTWSEPSGVIRLSAAKSNRGYLLRFHNRADYWVDLNGREILCVRKNGTPPETFRHLLLDQVIPLVINLRGEEALHASAVLTPEGVVAFSGHSGVGKSTLAAIFVRAGYPLLTDDCLVLRDQGQTICGVPGYAGLRLWKSVASDVFGSDVEDEPVAHYTTKCRQKIEMDSGSFCEEAQPIRGIFFLAESQQANAGEGFAIEELSPRDRMMGLLSHCFRMDITDRTMLRRQFRFFEHVTTRVPIRRVRLPQNPHRLPGVRDALLEQMGGTGTAHHPELTAEAR